MLVTLDRCECGEILVKIAITGPELDKCPKCSGSEFSNQVTDWVTNLNAYGGKDGKYPGRS